ncbi:hypothetical protein D3C86_1107600 [compost metagenome]
MIIYKCYDFITCGLGPYFRWSSHKFTNFFTILYQTINMPQMLLLSVDYLLSLALTELARTSWSLFYLPKIALQIILLQN